MDQVSFPIRFACVYSDIHNTPEHLTYRRILVYIFCLINIGLLLSDEAKKMKFLKIERA